VLAVVLAAPLLAAGALLVVADGCRAPDGTFAARVAPVTGDGYAVVVQDVDALLRDALPFARAGQTTVALSAADNSVPAFIGLAPRSAVASYLEGVAHMEIVGAGLGGGWLSLTLSTVDGDRSPPSLPGLQDFWTASSRYGQLHWSAGEIRGRHLALVLMGADAGPGLALRGRAEVDPGWLTPTAWAMIVLGLIGVAASMLLLVGRGQGGRVPYRLHPRAGGRTGRSVPGAGEDAPADPADGRPVPAPQPLAPSQTAAPEQSELPAG
jgi:hypothetical protein